MIGNPGLQKASSFAVENADIYTIAAGVATIQQVFVIVAAQSGTTDDLDTVTLGSNFAGIGTYRPTITIQADTGDTITVKHNTGNIFLYGAADVVLTGNQVLILFYNGSKWMDSAKTGGGTMSSFIVAGDAGTPQTIADGNTLSILGGTGLTSTASATDTLTLNLDNTAVTPASYTNTNLTVDQQGRITAASNGTAGMTSFDVAGDSGTPQTISNGNTLSILGGTALSSVASATDTVTVNLDNTAVTPGSYTSADITVDAQGRITAAASGSGGSSVADFCDFRLSLSSGVPIMTSNVTAATTVYAVPINLPYTEGLVTLKNGSTWETIFTGEASVALTGATASRPYDVFGYYDTGAMLIEILAWTNATTRATAIDVEDGHPIKSGDATRRWLGTIRITGTTGQCEFSPFPSGAPSKLLVWNLKNQVEIPFRVIEATDSYAYNTATWRQANASGNNQVEVIAGMIGSVIDITLVVIASPVATAAAIAIGEDSTSARATENVGLVAPAGTGTSGTARFKKSVALGYHFFTWLEIGNGGTTTWIGDAGTPDTIQSGMSGSYRC